MQKTTEATGDLIGNEITNKITNFSPQNNSETDLQTKEKSIKIPKVYFHRKKASIDDLRVIRQCNNGI